MKRRVVLVEVDLPEGRWSSRELEADLVRRLPELRPVVFGSIGASEVDGAYRKLRQLSRETEGDRSKGDRVHSAQKALSFFREMFPRRLWQWWEIGQPQPRRHELMK